MRIISGIYKGRKLSGKVPANVRPTQDALRETIFNIISNHFDFDGKVVCDLCAGTGALGLEALSRGADFAYFVDISKQSLACVKSAIDELSIEPDNYKIILSKAETFFDKFKYDKKVDVIFTDPPYSAGIINKILHSASLSEYFPEGGFFVAEYGSANALIIPDNFELLSERHFTISRFALLRKIAVE